MAELMLGQPLFPGESGIDQLVEIIKVLGTPTRDQIKTMNPNVSLLGNCALQIRNCRHARLTQNSVHGTQIPPN
jgi:hypothetical protein